MGTYTCKSTTFSESNLPEDLHQVMDDWAQEVLIVTQRPHSNSLSISRQQLWDQPVPRTHMKLLADASHVSFMFLVVRCKLLKCLKIFIKD